MPPVSASANAERTSAARLWQTERPEKPDGRRSPVSSPSQLVSDPAYQHKLRDDFRRRRVHPSIEVLIWNYHLGKPPPVLDRDERDGRHKRDASRRNGASSPRSIFRTWNSSRPESQGLVDRALALSRARITAASMPHRGAIEADPLAQVNIVAAADQETGGQPAPVRRAAMKWALPPKPPTGPLPGSEVIAPGPRRGQLRVPSVTRNASLAPAPWRQLFGAHVAL